MVVKEIGSFSALEITKSMKATVSKVTSAQTLNITKSSNISTPDLQQNTQSSF